MPQASKIPTGFTAVTPHIVCKGASAAMDFYIKAFGAVDEGRMTGPDGQFMHGEMSIGGARIMIGEESPEWGALGPKSLNGSPVGIHLYVDDADAFMAKAAKAGAKVTMPAADMFWGDRYGKLEDPFGHQWAVAAHVRDVPMDEMRAAMAKMCAENAARQPA